MQHSETHIIDEKIKRGLVLDEMFDLRLYQRLKNYSRNDLARILDELIQVETKHVKFWQDLFDLQKLSELTFGRNIKLQFFLLICRVFGERATFFTLEAIEVYGIRKYLDLWEHYKDTPFADNLKNILADEFRHEDQIISSAVKKKIAGDKIRNVFLGFNDGIVELLGAIAGFYVVFQNTLAVIIAGFTVAIAGSVSMAAGVYVSENSEFEIKDLERGRRRFFGEKVKEADRGKPLRLAVIVGISYIIGALIPITPAFFGSRSIAMSVAVSAIMIVIVSYILSFISGMDIRKRIVMNLGIIIAAVTITTIIGTIIKEVFGIRV